MKEPEQKIHTKKPISELIFDSPSLNRGFCIFVLSNGLLFVFLMCNFIYQPYAQIILSIVAFANGTTRPLLERVYAGLIMVLVLNSISMLLAGAKLATEKWPKLTTILFGKSGDWAESCFKLISFIFIVYFFSPENELGFHFSGFVWYKAHFSVIAILRLFVFSRGVI